MNQKGAAKAKAGRRPAPRRWSPRSCAMYSCRVARESVCCATRYLRSAIFAGRGRRRICSYGDGGLPDRGAPCAVLSTPSQAMRPASHQPRKVDGEGQGRPAPSPSNSKRAGAAPSQATRPATIISKELVQRQPSNVLTRRRPRDWRRRPAQIAPGAQRTRRR